MKRRDVGELQQGKRRRRPSSRRGADASSATAAVGLSHVLVEVVERRQRIQADVTRVALLRLVSVDGLQVDLQHGQAVEVSLGAVGARVGHFAPVRSSACG